MEPGRHRRRQAPMRPLMRLLAGAALALVLSWVPIDRVAACDCMFVELPDAIRTADVAFVGRLSEQSRVPDITMPANAAIDWRWTVEASRDAGTEPEIVLSAWPDDGANCGVSFGVGERWLVVASVLDGQLQTNSCMSNVRMDGSSPDTEALIEEMVASPVQAGAPDEVALPGPMLVVIGAVVAVGLVGLIAFRRQATDV